MAMKVCYTVVNGRVMSENRNGVERDYSLDPLGNTRALYDNTQTKTDTFTYTPSGTVATRTGTTPTPFQWNGGSGYYRNSSTRTYVRARNYFVNLGRWSTQDPIGFAGGDYNLYRYVKNRFVTATDPSGLQCDSEEWNCKKGSCRTLIVNINTKKLPEANCGSLSLSITITGKTEFSLTPPGGKSVDLGITIGGTIGATATITCNRYCGNVDASFTLVEQPCGYVGQKTEQTPYVGPGTGFPEGPGLITSTKSTVCIYDYATHRILDCTGNIAVSYQKCSKTPWQAVNDWIASNLESATGGLPILQKPDWKCGKNGKEKPSDNCPIPPL